MKKIISLLLALLMTFSVVTVAFAEGTEETTAPTETTAPATDEGEEGEAEGETEFGDLQWIMDLPFWTAKSGLKMAKVAFKLVSVFLKVGKIFGLVDKDMGDMLLEAIIDLIESSQNGEEVPEETTVAPETTAAAAA